MFGGDGMAEHSPWHSILGRHLRRAFITRSKDAWELNLEVGTVLCFPPDLGARDDKAVSSSFPALLRRVPECICTLVVLTCQLAHSSAAFSVETPHSTSSVGTLRRLSLIISTSVHSRKMMACC